MAEDEERHDDGPDPGTGTGDSGETAEPGLDETVVSGPKLPDIGPSGTRIMPAVPDEPDSAPPGAPVTPAAPVPPRWSARAQVPTPAAEADDTGYQYGHDQSYDPGYDQGYDHGYDPGHGPDGPDGREVEPPPGRPAWLMPTIIAVCVVLLIAAIGLGLWLIARGLQSSNPPSPITSAPGATTPVTTKPVTPTSTGPVARPVPDLRGQDFAGASAALTAQGLRAARSDEPSDTIPAGKVIRTDPAAGTIPPLGTPVIVYISTGKPAPTKTQVPPSPSPS